MDILHDPPAPFPKQQDQRELISAQDFLTLLRTENIVADKKVAGVVRSDDATMFDRVIRLNNVHFLHPVIFSCQEFKHTITFSRCIFEDSLDLAHSRFKGSLAFQYVWFPTKTSSNCSLRLPLSHIDGDLTIDGLISAGGLEIRNSKVQGHIKMTNVHVEGEVDLEGSAMGGDFQCRPESKQELFPFFPTIIRGHLNLAQTKIRGQVIVSGISITQNFLLGTAILESDLFCRVFHSKEHAQYDSFTSVKGNLIGTGSTIRGSVEFIATKIVGVTRFDLAEIHGNVRNEGTQANELTFYMAKIHGTFEGQSVIIHEKLELFGARIGHLLLTFCKNPHRPSKIGHLDAGNLEVTGNVDLIGLEIIKPKADSKLAPDLILRTSKIGGTLRLSSWEEDEAKLKSVESGEDFHPIRALKPQEEQPGGFIEGDVDFSGTTIGGDVNISNTKIRGTLLLTQCQIGGSVFSYPKVKVHEGRNTFFPSTSCSKLNMVGLTCKGDVTLLGLAITEAAFQETHPLEKFSNSIPYAVIPGCLDLTRANISHLVLSDHTFPSGQDSPEEKTNQNLHKDGDGSFKTKVGYANCRFLQVNGQLLLHPTREPQPPKKPSFSQMTKKAFQSWTDEFGSYFGWTPRAKEAALNKGVILQGTNLQKVEIFGIPSPLDLDNLHVGWWILANRESLPSDDEVNLFKRFLRQDPIFKSRTYKLVESNFRNQGKDSEADAIYREGQIWSYKKERKYIRSFLLWSFIGYGTRATVLLLLMAALFAFNLIIFWESDSVSPSYPERTNRNLETLILQKKEGQVTIIGPDESTTERKLRFEETSQPWLPKKEIKTDNWRMLDILLFLSKYHFPFISFEAQEQFSPSTDCIYPLDHSNKNASCCIGLTYNKLATITSLFSWISWPLIIARLAGIMKARA